MQWDIVAHIRCIHAGSSLQKHLDKFRVTFFGAPVQRAEAMIISVETKIIEFMKIFIKNLIHILFRLQIQRETQHSQ